MRGKIINRSEGDCHAHKLFNSSSTFAPLSMFWHFFKLFFSVSHFKFLSQHYRYGCKFYIFTNAPPSPSISAWLECWNSLSFKYLFSLLLSSRCNLLFNKLIIYFSPCPCREDEVEMPVFLKCPEFQSTMSVLNKNNLQKQFIVNKLFLLFSLYLTLDQHCVWDNVI